MASIRLNLARKYRPQGLEEMTGQQNVVRILQEALKSNRIAPAYLFSGPRGVGKTSSARIFAKAASCHSKDPEKRPCLKCASCEAIAQGKMMDILEIDGASHTGVDDVRRIIESVAYRPSIGAKNVYIVDEVHMLSNAAFNALLKTLEEPPPHALFLFATTEPEKIPSTILSRVQRLELQRLKDKEISENLQEIAKKEKIKVSDQVIDQIVTAADGSLRDGQTLLEQMTLLSSSTEISESVVDAFLGTIGTQQEILLLQLIAEQKSLEVIEKIHHYSEKGKDLSKLLARLIHWTRGLLLSRSTGSLSIAEQDCPKESLEKLEASFKDWGVEDMDRLFEILWLGHERMKKTDLPKISLETSLLRACRIPKSFDLAKILDYIESSPAEQAAPSFQAMAPSTPPAYRPPASKPATKASEIPRAAVNSSPAQNLEEVLHQIKAKRPSLHALLKCASKMSFQDFHFKLIFPNSHFAFRQLSDQLMKSDLEKSLSEICAQKVSLEVLEDTPTNMPTKVPGKTDLIIEAKKQMIEDPEILKATEILKGKISSVTIEGIKT